MNESLKSPLPEVKFVERQHACVLVLTPARCMNVEGETLLSALHQQDALSVQGLL